MSIRLNSPSRLLRAIQLTNPNYTFTADDVVYGLPVVLPEDHSTQRNTSVHVTASVNSNRYILDQTVYYNRNDLAVLFTGVVDIGNIATLTDAAVIARINDLFGMALEEDDVYVEEFTEGFTFTGTVTLVAKETSLGYIGRKSVTATLDKIPLYVAIANNVLDGLFYPPIELDPPAVIVENTTLTSVAVNPDTGNMYNGTGNPVTGFFTANDGRLELAIAARRWQSGVVQPTVGNVVSIELAENQDWNIPMSVATLGDIAGTRPVDHYEVFWTVTNVNTQEEMIWELRDSEINDGNQDWVCITHALPNNNGNVITDNAGSPDDSVQQNIQRLTFYPNVFPLTDRLTLGPMSFIGSFDVSLSARRKDALAYRQEVKIRVEVTRAA